MITFTRNNILFGGLIGSSATARDTFSNALNRYPKLNSLFTQIERDVISGKVVFRLMTPEEIKAEPLAAGLMIYTTAPAQIALNPVNWISGGTVGIRAIGAAAHEADHYLRQTQFKEADTLINAGQALLGDSLTRADGLARIEAGIRLKMETEQQGWWTDAKVQRMLTNGGDPNESLSTVGAMLLSEPQFRAALEAEKAGKALGLSGPDLDNYVAKNSAAALSQNVGLGYWERYSNQATGLTDAEKITMRVRMAYSLTGPDGVTDIAYEEQLDGSMVTQITYRNGITATIIERLDGSISTVLKTANGTVLNYTDSVLQSDGSRIETKSDSAGNITGTEHTITYDDGSKIVTSVNFATGVVSETTYNAPEGGQAYGTVYQTAISTPIANGVQTTTMDGSGQVISIAATTTQSNGSRVVSTSYPDGRTETVVYNRDGVPDTRTVVAPSGQVTITDYALSGRVETVTLRQTDDDGNVMSTTTHADGRTSVEVHTPDGTISYRSLPAPQALGQQEVDQAQNTTTETPQQTAPATAQSATDNPSIGGLGSDTTSSAVNQYATMPPAPPPGSGSGSGSGVGGSGTSGNGDTDPLGTFINSLPGVDSGGGDTSASPPPPPPPPPAPAQSSSSSSSDPIVLDLDGNGIHLSSPSEGVLADVSGTGWLQPVGWVAEGDAFLAFDANYNGQIDGVSEIQFTHLSPGATTDLAGLRALDEDGDGALTAVDAAWAQLRVWQDGNRNAVAEDGEVRSLADVGITSISLRSDNVQMDQNGNVIHGTGSAQTGGGAVVLGDVSLSVLDLVATTSLSGVAGQTVRRPIPTASQTLYNGTDANESISMTAGRDIAWGRGGNDYLAGGAGNDIAFGGDGNDVLLGGDGNDFVSGNNGNDLVYGEAGDDTLYGGAGDDALYGGSGNDTLYAGSGNDSLDGGEGANLLYGGAGDDTYIVHSASDSVREEAGQGNDSIVASISYRLSDAAGTAIENLSLTGNADLNAFGNALNNRLVGNAGANVIDGGAGADAMRGGAGDDVYVVDNADDTVTEYVADGFDTVLSSVSYSLSANIENLNLAVTGSTAYQGTGNRSNNLIVGNASANLLDGRAGNDVLWGGAGDDLIIGGAGNDIVMGEDGDDVLLGSAGYPSQSQDLAQQALTGTVITAVAADADAGVDYLLGGAGNDLLDGGGGADLMAGGAGNDVYIADNRLDEIVEGTDEGQDTVIASTAFTLSSNVENLLLIGNASVGTGNELDNVLRNQTGHGATLLGGAGNDQLFGGAAADVLNGGTGADLMVGGAGDDAYRVDNAGDQVLEVAAAGIEHVTSSVDYTLTANVENLRLVSAATLGTGNELANIIEGNDLGNTLSGLDGDDQLLGGYGDDTLLGGAGNDQLHGLLGADQMLGDSGDDRYFVDDVSAVVIERATEGNDTVYASVNYSTAANVENLILTGNAITGTGNELSNVLVGNAHNNTLSAGAGNDLLAGWLGNDLLDGGTGNDTYLYNQGDGRDSISDASGTDTVRFGAGISLDSLAAREYTTADGQHRVYISVLDTNGEEQADQGIDFALDAQTVTRTDDHDESGGTEHGKNKDKDGEDTITVYSSPIEAFVLADGSQFTLEQLKPGVVKTDGTKNDDILTGSRADDIMDADKGNDVLFGRTGNDSLYGGNGIDQLFGEGGHDKLYGGNDADWLQGGYGNDLLEGDNGRDTLLGGAGNDQLFGGNDDDLLDGGNGDDVLIGGNGADALYAGTGNDRLSGGNGSDLLASGAGDDQIEGGNGDDLIVAGSGADLIDAGNGNDFIDAGAGDDRIVAGNGDDFIVGGKGNDRIDAGKGLNVIAFNRGDGQDILLRDGEGKDDDHQQNTLSLGGDIGYADLKLKKTGRDLLLDLGAGDQITLENWYGEHGNDDDNHEHRRSNLVRLQMIMEGADFDATSSDRLRNQRTVSFDFQQLVQEFDQALAANPSLGAWSPAASLNSAYLSGGSAQPIGGDLAYRYATLYPSTQGYGDLAWTLVAQHAEGDSDDPSDNDSNQDSDHSSAQTLTISTLINPWAALQAGTSLILELPTGAPSPITPVAPLTQDALVISALNSQAQISGLAKPAWL